MPRWRRGPRLQKNIITCGGNECHWPWVFWTEGEAISGRRAMYGGYGPMGPLSLDLVGQFARWLGLFDEVGQGNFL